VREYGCCSMSTTRTRIELTAATIERLCARRDCVLVDGRNAARGVFEFGSWLQAGSVDSTYYSLPEQSVALERARIALLPNVR
jgi:hypothetical protein